MYCCQVPFPEDAGQVGQMVTTRVPLAILPAPSPWASTTANPAEQNAHNKQYTTGVKVAQQASRCVETGQPSSSRFTATCIVFTVHQHPLHLKMRTK